MKENKEAENKGSEDKVLIKADNLVKIYNASCHEVSSFRAQRLINEVIPYMPEGSFA